MCRWPCCHVISFLHASTGSPARQVTSVGTDGTTKWVYDPTGIALRLCVDYLGNTIVLSRDTSTGDILLTKLDRSGNVTWSITAWTWITGAIANEQPNAFLVWNIDTDSAGKIYCTMHHLASTDATNKPFAQRYDSAGNLEQTYSFTTTGLVSTFGAARTGRVDASGNLWVSGLKGDGRIYSLDSSGAISLLLVTSIVQINDVFFDAPNNKAFVIGAAGGGSHIYIERYPTNSGSSPSVDWSVTDADLVGTTVGANSGNARGDFDLTNGAIMIGGLVIDKSASIGTHYGQFRVINGAPPHVALEQIAASVTSVKNWSNGSQVLMTQSGLTLRDAGTFATIWTAQSGVAAYQVDGV